MGARVAKWYVYQLVDPRNDKPFYVGKGSGDRIKQHVRNHLNPSANNKAKNEVIKKIIDSGCKVVEREIARFFDEQDAYDFEYKLIRTTKGLTNIRSSDGPRKRYITISQAIRAAICGSTSFERAWFMMSHFKCHQLKKDEWLPLYLAAWRLLKKCKDNQKLRGLIYAS